MPFHLRMATMLVAFGLAGLLVSLVGPQRPAAASGQAFALAAGGELICRRSVKVGPLGVGARCVPAGRASELAQVR